MFVTVKYAPLAYGKIMFAWSVGPMGDTNALFGTVSAWALTVAPAVAANATFVTRAPDMKPVTNRRRRFLLFSI
jgi:hypothetical protein